MEINWFWDRKKYIRLLKLRNEKINVIDKSVVAIIQYRSLGEEVWRTKDVGGKYKKNIKEIIYFSILVLFHWHRTQGSGTWFYIRQLKYRAVLCKGIVKFYTLQLHTGSYYGKLRWF